MRKVRNFIPSQISRLFSRRAGMQQPAPTLVTAWVKRAAKAAPQIPHLVVNTPWKIKLDATPMPATYFSYR